MKIISAFVVALALVLSAGVMAKPEGGGDGGSKVFERAMATTMQRWQHIELKNK